MSKPNAFLLFMRDYKKDEEAKGRKFPNGLSDVQRDPKCSEIWQNMTPQEKGQYKSRAKDIKYGAKNADKKTCTGESITQLEKAEKDRQMFEQTMIKYITSVTQPYNCSTSKFFFIHVNHFYMKQTSAETFDYCPAEFAVIEFSLEDGLGDVYHEIMKVQVPIGYTLEAMDTSLQSHQIPTDLADGEHDFYAMYYKLEEFVMSKVTDSKFPPFFTKMSIQPKVQSLFRRMTDAVDVDPDTLYVYSLDILFNQLINCAFTRNSNVINIPLPVARRELDIDRFAYTPGLECDFHHSLDSAMIHCSMSVVKRWGFTICDHCCQPMGIEMVSSKHFPMETESLAHLSLNVTPMQPILSMTGVSVDHRIRTSQRTHDEEQIRRKTSEPVVLINHSCTNNTPQTSTFKPEPVYERPLRTPKTQSIAMVGLEGGSSQVDDSDFPPLGRGGSKRKDKSFDPKKCGGRGRGWF